MEKDHRKRKLSKHSLHFLHFLFQTDVFWFQSVFNNFTHCKLKLGDNGQDPGEGWKVEHVTVYERLPEDKQKKKKGKQAVDREWYFPAVL